METNMQHIQPADQTVSAIVGQLKSQGIFDEFRRDCIADVDTKPAYQNLRQRVEIYVSKFLSQQTWCTDLNKNQLRDSLRRSINESGVLAWGVDHLVDQVVTPKIYNVFYPQIETVVKEYLGLENRIFLPDLSVPPPGMSEIQERIIDQRPPEPREEIKSNKELQLNDGNKASTICNAGVGEQCNISESAQMFVGMLIKSSSEAVDKVGAKLEERPKSPVESREENAEGTNILKVKSEIPDSSDVPMKTGSETKVHCLDEQKKTSIEKKLEQDAHCSVTEKSKNTKEKDKDGKFRRDRSASECSDRETQKSVGEKKDHVKTSAHKKSGIDSVKYDKEKKLDKHKTTEKEKLKSDAVKVKDLKKHESEKVEKKLVQKSDTEKSGSDSSKLKHSKTTDMQKKSHKYDGSHSKSSTHNTDSLKCNKPDEKNKVDSNVKAQKFSEHKSFNKLDKTDKSKTVKSDMKGKTDQDSSKPRSDSKQKSFDGSSLKLNKHASESKSKHLDSKTKSHGTQEKSLSKQTAEKKSHNLSSSQKSESADKIRHGISDKKHPERTRSTELCEYPLRSECPEAKRIKLDQASTSGHKKSDKHSTNHSHSKHLSEKERKGDSSKDNRNKTHHDKQKISKVSEKPRHSHSERNTDDTSSKTNREKSTERKSSSSNEKQKSSNDKLKLPSSSDKQQQSSSSDKHKKAEEYRLLKEKTKRKEKSGEMKHEKYSKKVKPVREESSRTSSEGSSKSKDDTIKTKDDIDYLSSVSQKWKIQSQESSNSKDCMKQSPCCNFSPEACSESESHSSKGSDILLNIRPVLGISPSQESCFESVNDSSEKTKLTSEILSHPKELDRITERQTRTSSDEKEDTSKITQVGIGWEGWLY